MADRKWSELSDTTPQDDDGVALERGGTENFRWTFTALRGYLGDFFATDVELSSAINSHNADTGAHNGNLPTTDQKAAMDGANSPSGGNPFATIADTGGSGDEVTSASPTTEDAIQLGDSTTRGIKDSNELVYQSGTVTIKPATGDGKLKEDVASGTASVVLKSDTTNPANQRSAALLNDGTTIGVRLVTDADALRTGGFWQMNLTEGSIRIGESGNIPSFQGAGSLNVYQLYENDVRIVTEARNVSSTNSIVGGGNLSADRTFQLDGDAANPGVSKLYGTNVLGVKGWYDQPSGGGGGGTLTTVRQDSGADISTGRSRLNFIEGANITLSISDDAGNDEVDITITSTAAGGGGGDMLSPTGSVAVGELYQADDTSGIQTAGTGILASTVVRTDIANTFTTVPQAIVTTDNGGGFEVEANQTARFALKSTTGVVDNREVRLAQTNDGRFRISAHDDTGTRVSDMVFVHNQGGVVVGSPTGADQGFGTLNASNVYRNGSALLADVIDDTSPQLGGKLETRGQIINITNGSDESQAGIGNITSGAARGAYFVYSHDGTTFESSDGGIGVLPGSCEIYGVPYLDSLTHSTNGGRDVKVSETGILYAVDPPPVEWADDDTDPGAYSRAGVGVGTWQQITGLEVTAGGDVAAGSQLNIAARVYTVNGVPHEGTVEIGVGVNGAAPTTTGEFYDLAEYQRSFLGYERSASPVALSNGDTMSVWMRVTAQSDSLFSTAMIFDGTGGNVHELYIGRATSGGSGGGDVVQGSPIGVSGDATVWTDVGAKTIASAGYQASDVARVNVANSFTASPQTIITTDSGGGIDIEANNTARIRLKSTAGIADNRECSLTQTNTGFFRLSAHDEGGTRVSDMMLVYNQSGVVIGSPTGGDQGFGAVNAQAVYEQGEVLSYPTQLNLSGTTPTIACSAGNSSRKVLTNTGTITPDASGFGESTVYIQSAAATLTLTNFTVHGTEPSSRPAYCSALVIVFDDSSKHWYWGV